jgi:ribonucleotide reductase beta subunit family protein with ferritin-like domain
MGIEIFSKMDCKYCTYAENICIDMNLDYKKVMVDKNDLKKYCGAQAVTYPQIKMNDKCIGDYFAFQDYIEECEPMLLPTTNRFTIFPIEHENLWMLYKKAQMSNWTAEEIDTSADMDDWNSLSDNERHFIKYILAFFAGSDGIVFENINNNFADEVQYTEARSFYAYQVHNEMVHGETYSKLIDKYIRNDSEKRKLFDAINTIEPIKRKADWALKWFDKSRPFSERLLAFACVEGIFFSGSFCAIFWLKKRGLMPGLCFSNELISRDEGLHLEFALELFHMLKNKPNEHTIHEIVKESVEIEKSFIIDSLPCKLIGMNAERMSEYIEYVADRLLKQAGFNKIWNTQNPFDFMENISLDGKTNFFEKRVGDYGKIHETTDVTFDDDF